METKFKQVLEWIVTQGIGLLMVVTSCTSLLFLTSTPNLSFLGKLVGFFGTQLLLYFVVKFLHKIGKV